MKSWAKLLLFLIGDLELPVEAESMRVDRSADGEGSD